MKPKTKPALVLVVRDPRNAKLDYALPARRAEELFRLGKLLWNMDLRSYVTPDRYAQVQ